MSSAGSRSVQYLQVTEPESLGINLNSPKFLHYATVSRRLETFKSWPRGLGIDPSILAEAGLIYTGKGDSCRCYHCGGGLRNWEPGEDPWTEHAKWYPKCGHVFLNKGREFIAKANGITCKDPMESVAAQSCLQMGCDKVLLKRAIERYIQQHGHSDFMAKDLLSIVMSMEDEMDTCASQVPPSVPHSRPSVESQYDLEQGQTEKDPIEELSEEKTEELLTENRELKEQQTCKICLDARASVIFLPCGHLVSCPLCAPALVRCPICRLRVRGTVKAYMTGFD